MRRTTFSIATSFYANKTFGKPGKPSKQFLKLLLFNARSVRNKWREIVDEVSLSDPDILCITETWLSEDETTAFNYNDLCFFHRCRGDRKGGGVSIFINPHFNPKLCPSDCKGVLSISFVLGKIQHQLSLVYRPPNATIQENMDIIKSLNDAKLSHYDIWTIVGNFNLPDVTYIFPFTRCRDLTYNMFFDFFSDNLLHQLVQAPTRGNATLDLVWTNDMNMIDNVEVTSPIANSDHNTVTITSTGSCSESGKTEPTQKQQAS